MDATKPSQHGHEVRHREGVHEARRHDGELDRRYGKIGISAVAAAVRCKGVEPRKAEPQRKRFDRD